MCMYCVCHVCALQLYVNVHLQWNLSIICPNGVLYSEVPLYVCVIGIGIRDTSLYRTASWVPVVSTIERFHCIMLMYVAIASTCMYV